ncbi:MAG: permease prefix domain 1-containing protein, partial [Longimicrobiales bacterium]
MFSDLRLRLRGLFRRQQMERELDEELRFHLEHEIAKHVRAGVAPAEAERLARADFGGLDVIKEEARDARGIVLLDAVLQDLRYGWRSLRARPGFAAAVVLTLGLGIGTNAAMFGVVDRLLFRPPAFLSSPERVHRVFVSYLWNGSRRTEHSHPYKRYEDLSNFTHSFDASAAFEYRNQPVGLGEQARELMVGSVSASYFDFFAARPVLGRFFTAQDDQVRTARRVAVLGYNFWQSEYSGSRAVLG